MKGDTGSFSLAANQAQEFPAGKANYLYVREATGAIHIELWKNRTLVEEHNADLQFNLTDKDFDEFRVIDKSGATNTVQIWFGPGKYDPPANRTTVTIDDADPINVDLVAGSVTLNQQSISNGATSVADVSCGAAATTAVVTASASNVRVRVTNLASNTNTMRIGLHSGVGATNGSELPPGATLETETQAGVWVYNPGAGAESVAVEVEIRT